jgi:hypothetical protein
VEPDTLARVIDYWRNVDAEIGAQVAKGLSNGGGQPEPVPAQGS